MAFPKKVVEDLLVACNRCCCICHKYCGTKIEVHHIIPQSEGGQDTMENAIALCFNCHAEVMSYNINHPKGRKFSPRELMKHKEQWLKICSRGSSPDVLPSGIQGEDIGIGVTIPSPISRLCLGRATELKKLETDLTHKNVLLIKGIAGIGKTTLGLKFRDILEEKGYQTVWYQCDSESYETFLTFLSDYLKNRGSITFQSLRDQGIAGQERLKTAVQELCTYPTVLFLDNFHELHDAHFQIFQDHLRNSTLVVMSRVQPTFLKEGSEDLLTLDEESSFDLLKKLEVNEPLKVLEKIYEKTKGHPWSLVRFADLAHVLPVNHLLDELPDFGRDQEDYMNEECWKYLNEHEKDFLMRASVFTKPLTFEALEVCSKKGILSEVLFSLVKRFYVEKREEYYYIHDIMKDFALSKLKENSELYIEAEKAAADYYKRKISAENLLLVHDHLKEAGDYKEALDSITKNINYFWREGYWSDVKEVLEESLDFFEDEETRADIYFNLGTIVEILSEWDTAIDYYQKSLEISEKIRDIHGMGRTYSSLGTAYNDKDEWDKAIDYHQKSLDTFERIGDIHGMALTYIKMGVVYYRKGEWDKAINYYEDNLKIFKEMGDINLMATTRGNLSLVYYRKGEWDKAINYYEEILEIFKEVGGTQWMAQTYSNLGMVYSDKYELYRAIDYYQKSLEISEEIGDIHEMARTYDALGRVYHRKDEWDTAIDYHLKSLEIFEKIGDVHSMAMTWGNLAEAYCGKDDIDTALDYCNNSFEILEKRGDRFRLANAHRIYGIIFRKRKELQKSKEELEKSIGIYQEFSVIYELAKTFYELAVTLLEIGDTKNAREYFKKALNIFKKLKVNHYIKKVEEQLKTM
jgi:tetratricopeptide (TPR) repeat protein